MLVVIAVFVRDYENAKDSSRMLVFVAGVDTDEIEITIDEIVYRGTVEHVPLGDDFRPGPIEVPFEVALGEVEMRDVDDPDNTRTFNIAISGILAPSVRYRGE